MLSLNSTQAETKKLIEDISKLINLDPLLTSAIALTESSLGINLLSPTKCRGVFGMSSIAMKDLLLEMHKPKNRDISILCGLAFIKLLIRRWGNEQDAINHFCSPKDRVFYNSRIKKYKQQLSELNQENV